MPINAQGTGDRTPGPVAEVMAVVLDMGSVGEFMVAVPRRVDPDTPAATVAQIMSEYNLMALPVTDRDGRLLGIVGVDDALEVILPDELRRRIPRVFS